MLDNPNGHRPHAPALTLSHVFPTGRAGYGGSSAEAGFRPGHRNRCRRHRVRLYKPRTLELFVKLPTLSVQWHRYRGRFDTVFLHGSRYHSFRICAQTLMSAAGACSLTSSQQACHFGGC